MAIIVLAPRSRKLECCMISIYAICSWNDSSHLVHLARPLGEPSGISKLRILKSKSIPFSRQNSAIYGFFTSSYWASYSLRLILCTKSNLSGLSLLKFIFKVAVTKKKRVVMRLEGRYSDPVVIVYLFQCTSKREHVKIDINVKFDSSNLPLSIRLKTRQCFKDFYFIISETPNQPKKQKLCDFNLFIQTMIKFL